MTIHRVGPAPDTAPHRVELGHVLVTIDDLQALADLLQSSTGSSRPITFQFAGGYFTDPNDLKLLSDEEIKFLTVKSADVEVILSEREAVAVGDGTKTANIYRLWARARQTRNTRELRFARIARAIAGLLVPLVIVAVLVAILRIVGVRVESGIEVPFPVGVALIIGLTIVAILSNYRLAGRFFVVETSAHIVAMSMHEYRALAANNRYPRASWIVAIVAVIVAIIAIIAPLAVG